MRNGLLAVFALVCILGCSPSKIAEKALQEYKASAGFPQDCSDSFPTVTDTAFLPGVTDTIVDYRYYDDNGVELVRLDTITKLKVVEVTRTIRKTDTIRIKEEVTAKLEATKRQAKAELEAIAAELAKADAALERQVKKTANRTSQRNWGWGLFAALAAWNFRHQILGLFTGGVGKGIGFFLGLFKRKNNK